MKQFKFKGATLNVTNQMLIISWVFCKEIYNFKFQATKSQFYQIQILSRITPLIMLNPDIIQHFTIDFVMKMHQKIGNQIFAPAKYLCCYASVQENKKNIFILPKFIEKRPKTNNLRRTLLVGWVGTMLGNAIRSLNIV